MEKRRDSFGIVADILIVCKSGAKEMEIIHKGNLNHNMFLHYLNAAIRAGLIEILPSGLYRTTQKGLEFVRDHEEFHEPIEKMERKSPLYEVWSTTLVV